MTSVRDSLGNLQLDTRRHARSTDGVACPDSAACFSAKRCAVCLATRSPKIRVSDLRELPSGSRTDAIHVPSHEARTIGHKDPYRSEEHTSELQSLRHLGCRLL